LASTVIALALLCVALVMVGLIVIWALGAILVLAAALCVLNPQALPAATRTWLACGRNYIRSRRDCWALSRIEREFRELEEMRWRELARQAAVSEWQQQRLYWLAAEYKVHRRLGERARVVEPVARINRQEGDEYVESAAN